MEELPGISTSDLCKTSMLRMPTIGYHTFRSPAFTAGLTSNGTTPAGGTPMDGRATAPTVKPFSSRGTAPTCWPSSNEALFLPWHRPYVLAFEQRLVETAIRLANQYPAAHRATYVKAAQTLRAPFWDWGYDARVPPVTVPNTLPVRVPNGSGLRTIQISNPLRYYRFPQSAIDQRFGSFSRDAQVFKCRAPQNYPNSANAAMASRSYRSWTYDAMTRSASFEEFASTGSSGISLEQIHNAVHWDGSCGFQFLDADYSAFDPLFMLHHVNVEELQRPCAIELFANVTSVGNFIVMKQPAQGLFYGKFSLDKAADPVELADTETKVVVSDLLAALRVQITKHDGTVQALESVPSFKLELENVDVTPPETDTELPEYTDAEKVTAPKEDLAAAPPS
ncbi:Tyrosinase like protein [Verticillium longisporum]|nr:Tyrosinase like protein [Verticillium longisporum]